MLLQTQGAPAPNGTQNAIAAGPLLSQTFPNGTKYIAVPRDDENVNIFEHSANTAVGLRHGGTELLLVTADGYDGCSFFDPTCGIEAYPFADYMIEVLDVDSSMNMDQGGSTTMWIKGEDPTRNGVVSCSQNAKCDGQPRHLYSGLFVGLHRSP